MISVFKIEDTVINVSKEAKTLIPSIEVTRSEKKLLTELILCILSSQEKYEIALSASKQIQRTLVMPTDKNTLRVSKNEIQYILSHPIRFTYQNKKYERRIRFFERKISYIQKTLENLYNKKIVLKDIVAGKSRCPYELRKTIMNHSFGLGPKQASMFLRNIGYSNELAVLDKHVVDYMQILGLTNLNLTSISRISIYQQMEQELRKYADQNKVGLLHLDLAIWTTMRTLKSGNYADCHIGFWRN